MSTGQLVSSFITKIKGMNENKKGKKYLASQPITYLLNYK